MEVMQRVHECTTLTARSRLGTSIAPKHGHVRSSTLSIVLSPFCDCHAVSSAVMRLLYGVAF